MNWARHEEGFKPLHAAMGIALVFFLMAFIYYQITLAACFAAVFAICAVQNIYYKYVGKDLKLLSLKNRKKILIGSSADIILDFQNGQLPILNGMLILTMDDAVLPLMEDIDHFSGRYDLAVLFSIGSNEHIQVRIPVQGNKRGLSRIRRAVINIPQIFGHGFVEIELKDTVKQESLVYPKITPFEGQILPSPFKPGELPQRQSLFYDALQPIGTRDYVPADRFDQIHWTASARMQKLQTKEYLPVTERSVTFIVNAIEKQREPQDFDLKIERLASYIHYCNQQEIPYEIFLNIKMFGDEPFVHRQTGIGNVQYQKSLEMLAELSERHAKIPYEKILQNIESQMRLSPTIVLITHEPERFNSFVKKWRKYREVLVDSAYGELFDRH